MGKALARLGDRTTHGGKVITASPFTFSMGKAVARVGDLVACPKKRHGVNPIVTGDPTLIIDGKPAARHGDKCACGCTLIASQHNTTTGGAGESSELLDDDSLAEMSFEDFFFAENDTFTEPEPYDDHFMIVDPHTHRPVANSAYALVLSDGQTRYGVTDVSGKTQYVQTAESPDVVEIHVQGAA